MYVHMHILYMCIYIYTYIHACIWIPDIDMHIYIYTYETMYTHTYTYNHIEGCWRTAIDLGPASPGVILSGQSARPELPELRDLSEHACYSLLQSVFHSICSCHSSCNFKCCAM